MSSDQLRADLRLKIATVLTETLVRELRIAEVVLPATEVTLLHLELAALVAAQACFRLAESSRDGVDPRITWDLGEKHIRVSLSRTRTALLEMIAKKRAGAIA